MKYRNRLFWPCSLLLLLFLTPAKLWAEELTWEQCIDLAGANNAELQAARQRYQAAKFQIRAEKGAYYPQLSGSVNVNRSDGEGGGFTGDSTGSTGDGSLNPDDNLGNFSGGDGTSGTAALKLNQSLFSGFQIDSKVAQAKANAEAAVASFDITRAKVSADLKTAAANIVYSRRYIELTENIIQRREENLRLVELRFESGAENKGSLLLSRASLSDAKLDRLQARNSQFVSHEQLAKVLALDTGTPIGFSGRVPRSDPVAVLDFKELLPGIPQRRQVQAQKDAAQAQVKIANSQFYPNLNLQGNASRQDSDSSSDRERYSVGLGVTYSFFTGGRDRAVLANATAADLAAGSDLHNIEEQLLVDLKKAYVTYSEAVERAKVDSEYAEAAKVRAEIARSKYNNGLLSFEDWDIIENDLINRQKAGLESERQRIIAEAGWEQVQGKGVLK